MLDLIDWRRAVPGVIAAMAMLVAVLADGWWTASSAGIDVGVGLRTMTLCGPGGCDSSSISGVGSGFFRATSALVFYGGLVAAAMFLFDSLARPVLGADSVPRLTGHLAAGLGPAAVMTAIMFPGVGRYGVGVGWAFWLFLVSCVLGIYAGFADRFVSGMGTGTYVPVVVDRDGDQPSGSPTADAGAATTSELSIEVGGGAASPPAVRFAVDTLRVDERGVWIVGPGGSKRMIRYLDFDSAVVRRLPPAPPYRGRIFADLLPLSVGDRPARPVRVLDSTEIAEMDGDASLDVRALVDRIRASNPALVLDEDTRSFLRGNRALALEHPESVIEHDQRYLGPE